MQIAHSLRSFMQRNRLDRLHGFVANRVTRIQDRIPPDHWRHVPSKMNPADTASRELFPSDLIASSLWWKGPTFLQSPEDAWPLQASAPSTIDECNHERSTVVLTVTQEPTFIDELLARYSKLCTLQRVTAYLLRFRFNATHQERRSGPLTSPELHQALLVLVRTVQQQVFAAEFRALRRRSTCVRAIQRLDPYIDEALFLRVGGRLHHSSMDPNAKHPLLLPGKHKLTLLIIENVHRKYLHVGLNTCMNILLQNFWILSARRAIRHVIFRCLTCYRQRPHPFTPKMGNLPEDRVTAVKPFSSLGVDFGRPYLISWSRHRGIKTHKAYLCIFVCFCTTAVHLELVSDLSTAAFLAALHRFIPRRGRCSVIHSDCGTNFVGAYRELKRLFQDAAEAEGITWKFNSPSAPHFGGLWESHIKRTKHHLSRVLGDQILTYEEFNSFFAKLKLF